ncbi:unnamed protein product [Angiostrongylus costaricensis]|uniref:Plasmid transfer protein n=1 Tax=Angiostrongylus costaricensis TaxID=334426 RepID=A0A0R3PQX2_ANGCS|nr:unnamed protein product [Angiostrongylus costaricensis]
MLTSVKIAFTPQQDDLQTGYTPRGARSVQELAVYNEYFSSQGQPITIYGFVMAKDDGSMSRLAYMDEAVKTLNFVTANIKHNGQSFSTICSDFCDMNEPIRHFYNGLVMKVNSSGIDERISITFPVMEVIGKEIDLSPNFYGVKTNSSDRTVQFLKLVLFQFRANPPKNWNRCDVQAYERRVVSYFNSEMKSNLLKIYGLSLTYASDEIVRTGKGIETHVKRKILEAATTRCIAAHFA